MRRLSLPVSVLATLGFFLASVASAADAPASAPPQQTAASSGDQIEEVIVTAQKREQNIKDVPTSISVLGGAALEEQHIVGYDDLTRAVPGVSFSAGGATGSGVGQESLEVRGIGSQVGSATVGLYLDEVPVTQLNQSGTFQPIVFDLDRIEVLRGPQGTLYGASSEGGTVRFITKQPNLEDYEADVTGDVSGTKHGGVNTNDRLVLNAPIIPGILAVRAGIAFAEQSGWIDRYQHLPGELDERSDMLLQSGVNTERDVVMKLSAKYQPDTDFSITPSILFQRQMQNDSPSFFFGEGLYNQSKSVNESARDEGVIPSLAIQKGVGFGEVTSITSYFYRQYDRVRDGTFYDPDIVVPYYLDPDPRTAAFAPIADVSLATNPTAATDRERSKVFTEELRLASEAKDVSGIPLTWVVGLFYSNNTDDFNHDEQSPGWNSTFESIYGYSPNDPVLSPISDPANPTLWTNRFYFDISRRGVAQYATFGQVDFDILPGLHGSVGLRYQYSKLTYSRVGGGWWDLGDTHNYSGDSADYALTPKFSVTYDLTPDTNIYATAAKGYRDGGVNNPVPATLCGPYEQQIGITSSPISYGPDKLWSYELGTKGLLLDRTLSLTADVYYIQWSNVQQQILIPVCAFQFISNVGDAESYGTELELQYKVPFVHGLTLGVSAGAEHAVITSSSGNGAAAVGQKLLFTPDWTATVDFTYNFPVTDTLTASIRGDYDMTGRSSGDFVPNQTDDSNKQYGVLNASVSVLTEDGLQVQLYAKNLANDTTIIKKPTVADVTEAYTVQPLTVGLSVSKHFAIPAESPPEAEASAPVVAAAPPPAPQAAAPEVQRSFQVFFDFDRSDVTEAAKSVIQAAADAAKAGNLVKIAVTGHTDTVGSGKYNQVLSEKRATAVKDALVADGLTGDTIMATGVGKTQLLVPTADGVREPQNRRAEIMLD